jgi:amphi-Trp domain-containing protein
LLRGRQLVDQGWRCRVAAASPWPVQEVSMGLIEHETEHRLRREEAAARLRELADQLARHNEVSFVREGIKYSVKVPDEVVFSLEIEVGKDESEIEIELTW